MAHLAPEALARTIGQGLLSFPVTHFDSALDFDETAYREHIDWLCEHHVAGLFAAGGTGEFFSLSTDEVGRVVDAAVSQTAGRVPVLAPAGGSVAVARQQIRQAESLGASGILLFPPYLTESSPHGLSAYIKAVCASTALGVVAYSRANGQLSVEALNELAHECPNLVGLKDGVGDIELMTRIYATYGDRFTYIGGLPTAETFALPYLELGVTTYSSAIFNFVPEFALEFYASVRSGDRDDVYRRLREFVLPYLEIRDRSRGYAVSIIKAGLDIVGRPAGPVRPPLLGLKPDEVSQLEKLVASLNRS